MEKKDFNHLPLKAVQNNQFLQIRVKVEMINMPFEDMNSGPLFNTCRNI